jgi:hypothetical protein
MIAAMTLSRKRDDSSSKLYPVRLAPSCFPLSSRSVKKRSAVRMNVVAIQPILEHETPSAERLSARPRRAFIHSLVSTDKPLQIA